MATCPKCIWSWVPVDVAEAAEIEIRNAYLKAGGVLPVPRS